MNSASSSASSSRSSSFPVFFPGVVANSVSERINHLINEAKIEFAQKNPENELLICPISFELPEKASVTNCGHLFDLKEITEFRKKKDSCPVCDQKITGLSSVFAVQNQIDKWQNQEPIPTLALFKKENPKLADRCLKVINCLVEEGEYAEALNYYPLLFIHTKALKNFAEMASLYEEIGDLPKASYAFLRLSLYSLEEKNIQKAIFALNVSKRLNNKLSIDSIISELMLLLNTSKMKERQSDSMEIPELSLGDLMINTFSFSQRGDIFRERSFRQNSLGE